jgi:hypothetical protein
MLTNLAPPVYVMRFRRDELNVMRHIVLPVIGTLVIIFPLWGLVEPGQSWPFNIFPWVALAVLVLALIYGLIIARLSPELAHRTGSYVADE